MEKFPIQKFDREEIPEFQRVKQANPEKEDFDPLGIATMYGKAIQWISILDVIWPDFEKMDYLTVDAAYIVINDPDDEYLPDSFHKYIAQMIAMFWELQLKEKYPNGKWLVDIDDEPEISVRVEITSRL